MRLAFASVAVDARNAMRFAFLRIDVAGAHAHDNLESSRSMMTMAIDPRHLRTLMAKIRYRAPEPSRGGGRFHRLYPADRSGSEVANSCSSRFAASSETIWDNAEDASMTAFAYGQIILVPFPFTNQTTIT